MTVFSVNTLKRRSLLRNPLGSPVGFPARPRTRINFYTQERIKSFMLSEEKLKRMEMLQRNGVSVYGIAQELNIDRKTVKKYLGPQLPLGDRDGYVLPQFPEQQYPMQQFTQPRQPQMRRPHSKAEAEMYDIIRELDRYDQIYNLEPPTPEERYLEEKKIKEWQREQAEALFDHQIAMNNLRYRHRNAR